MKQNKILGAAIIAALAVGSGNVQATNPTLTFDVEAGTASAYGTTFGTSSETIAIEDVGDNNPTFMVNTKYVSELTANTTEMLYITYTLTGGEWAVEPDTGSFNISAPDIGYSKSEATDTTARFLIMPGGSTGFGKSTPVTFGFKVGELSSLQQENGSVTLTAELAFANGNENLEKTDTTKLLESAAGTLVSLNASSDNVEIDVAQGATKFTDGNYGTQAVSLGTLQIANTTAAAKKVDLSPWSIGTDVVESDAGTLVIENGPFAASGGHAHDSTDPATGYFVFLAPTASKCVPSTAAIPAKKIEGETKATWDLVDSNIVALAGVHDICVRVADGNLTPINETDAQPEGTVTINYVNRTNTVYPTTRLLHIKRNGTVCSLYNVPSDGATDIVNIRITNRSTREGILQGQLKDMNGELLFEGDLLNGQTLAPNATIRLTASNLEDLMTAAGHATGTWSGRAVLTISSDLTQMEVFGLLRNKAGGPLLNMSVGGSGNGCD
jgi:hypothetical protein